MISYYDARSEEQTHLTSSLIHEQQLEGRVCMSEERDMKLKAEDKGL